MPETLRWTAAEEEALLSSLERALCVAAKARSSDHGLFFQIIQIRDHQDQGLEEIRDLLNHVRAIPALYLFSQTSPDFLGNCREVNHITLVKWMISRAQIVGSEQTVRDLANYLEAEILDLTEIMTIDGISLTESIEVGDYILVPWDQIPLTDWKWEITLRALYDERLPSAAITRKWQIPGLRASGSNSMPSPLPSSIHSMFEVLGCITAVVGAGIRFLHYWVDPPEWAPWTVQPNTFGIDGSVFPMPSALTQASAEEINACVKLFFGLERSQQQRLFVPIDRLNKSYVVGVRSVDAAIELGIALESLYAPTKLSGEIAYTIRTRAARFLGGTREEREETAKSLKQVYDLRSRAIHAGRFDVGEGWKKWKNDALVRDVLESGKRIVGRSLVKVIHEGEPDWEAFDLGNGD